MNILLFGDTLFRMAAFITQRIRERALERARRHHDDGYDGDIS